MKQYRCFKSRKRSQILLSKIDGYTMMEISAWRSNEEYSSRSSWKDFTLSIRSSDSVLKIWLISQHAVYLDLSKIHIISYKLIDAYYNYYISPLYHALFQYLQFSKIPFLELIKVMYEYFIFVGSLKCSDYVILKYSSKETIVLFHKLVQAYKNVYFTSLSSCYVIWSFWCTCIKYYINSVIVILVYIQSLDIMLCY